MKKIVFLFMIICIVIGVLYILVQPVDVKNKKDVIVDITKGANIIDISEKLKDKDLINSKVAFVLYSKISKLDNIKAGKYKLYKSYSTEKILTTLNEGKTYKELVKLVVPEGFEAHQIGDRLESLNLSNKTEFMNLVNNASIFYDDFLFLKENNINTLEGFLFPDTYVIEKNENAKNIVKMMLKRFEKIYYKDEYIAKQEEMGFSLNQVISLASIIEREAMKKDERSIISGIFYNRLKSNMPLQSCATVQYILGERKKVLSLDDVKINSPYNTYVNKGLPPSPIASPGEDSIKAALYPKESTYLYFVAKKDGSHSFSNTYEEHLKRKAENEKK